MQYLVQVSGTVKDTQSKVYVVSSNSEKDAETIAKENFKSEFSTNKDVVCIKSDKRTKRTIWTFCIMLIPILLSFINWKNGHDTISISPDYISCLYSILIYVIFVIRFKGIKRTTSSWIDILFCVFIPLLLASFIKTILVTKTFSIFGIWNFSINSNAILIVAIILSCLGIKFVSLACIPVIAIMALSNMFTLNEAMGKIFGPLYIICSFISIILYLSVEPVCSEIILQFKNVALKGMKHLTNDVKQAKNEIKDLKKAVSKDNDADNRGN